MSDSLKKAIALPASTWTKGEQPSSAKLDKLFKAYKRSIEELAKVIGPAKEDNSTAINGPRDTLVSSKTYSSFDLPTKANLTEEMPYSKNLSFNLTRMLGPSSALNPTYLPGRTYSKDLQSTGWPLIEGRMQQALPFPPLDHTDESTFDFGDPNWEMISPHDLSYISLEEGHVGYYVTKEGILYTNIPCPANYHLKYSLIIPNTEYPVGSSYNCIPDPRILLMDNESRIAIYPGSSEYGACKIVFESTDEAYSTWELTIPYIIAIKDPITDNEGLGTFSLGAFEPVGYTSEGEEYARYFIDSNNPLFSNEYLEENTILLYNISLDKTYDVAIQRINEKTYRLTGPVSLIDEWVNDDGSSLVSEENTANGKNSKDFFLFMPGTNISQTLAQLALNFSRHSHNGADSPALSHSSLMGTKEEFNSPIGMDNTVNQGGLDFLASNKTLRNTTVPNNGHPQYLSRYGFGWGGTQGMYLSPGSFLYDEDFNRLHGDLVLAPFEQSYRTYTFDSGGEALGDPTSRADYKNWIDWKLEGEPSIGNSVDKRSHAIIFGTPNFSTAPSATRANLFGATKMYFETSIMTDQSKYDNQGSLWSLSRHGFIPGNETSGGLRERGLNIGWGHLFFGYREDILGGSLTGSGAETTPDRSANWKTSEFNILVTANGKAGRNTDDWYKENQKWKDGFNVRGVKGASIYLGVGGEKQYSGVDDNSTSLLTIGPINYRLPGIVAVVADLSSGNLDSEDPIDNDGGLSLNLSTYEKRTTQGSGFIFSPSGIRSNDSNSIKSPLGYNVNYSFGKLWNGQNIGKVIDFDHQKEGAFADLFCLSPESLISDHLNNSLDQSITSLSLGRLFLRGSLGINFCSDTRIDEEIDFETTSPYLTGFTQKDNNQNWGYTDLDNTITNKSYISREFRFWGKNEDENPSRSNDSLANTMGGNLNLMYNWGRSYNRFGRSYTWNENALNHKQGWSSIRGMSLGSSKPENYGSSIRQASYIEAFQGTRNDPRQPFTMQLVIPFAAYWKDSRSIDDYITDDIDLETVFTGKQVSLVDAIFADQVGIGSDTLNSENVVLFNTLLGDSDDSLDRIIRGAEEIFIQNSGTLALDKMFPRSITSFKVNLEYFTPVKVESPETTAISATKEGELQFAEIFTATSANRIKFESANKIKLTTKDPNNILPIVFSNNTLNNFQWNNSGNWGPGYKNSKMLSYGDSLGLIPLKDLILSTEEIFREDHFGFVVASTSYDSLLSKGAFCPILSFESSPYARQEVPLSYPYRIFVYDKSSDPFYPFVTEVAPEDIDLENTDHALAIEIKGKIVINFISHASPMYNSLTTD